jgi:hypothetical protein
VLYMYYESTRYRDRVYGAATDKVIGSSNVGFAEECCSIEYTVAEEGGFEVCNERGDGGEEDEDGKEYHGEYDSDKVERVVWVTPVTTFNSHQTAFGAYGNQPSLELAHAHLCMFVLIGKAGERLVYPSVSQLGNEWEIDDKKRCGY